MWRVRLALLAIALAAYANSFGLGLAQDSKAIVAQDARLGAVTADCPGFPTVFQAAAEDSAHTGGSTINEMNMMFEQRRTRVADASPAPTAPRSMRP